MSWKNRSFKKMDDVNYPFIQWVNDGGSLNPRSKIGGFGFDVEQAAILGANIPGERSTLHHRGGGHTEVIFTTQLKVAVLDTRFTWQKDGQAIPAYEPGARSKLQALALTLDSNGDIVGPVMLTFRGYTSKHFGEALKTHRNAVRVATANEAPAYAFFGQYTAGEIELVGSNGQQSPITTLVYAGDENFDPDAAYVGDEALDAVDWDQVEAWKKAWDMPGGNGSNGDDDDDPKPAPKPAPNFNGKASRKQWASIRQLLTSIKYVGTERQNTAIEEAGFDPGKLTAAQASKLIERLQAAVKAAAKK